MSIENIVRQSKLYRGSLKSSIYNEARTSYDIITKNSMPKMEVHYAVLTGAYYALGGGKKLTMPPCHDAFKASMAVVKAKVKFTGNLDRDTEVLNEKLQEYRGRASLQINSDNVLSIMVDTTLCGHPVRYRLPVNDTITDDNLIAIARFLVTTSTLIPETWDESCNDMMAISMALVLNMIGNRGN